MSQLHERLEHLVNYSSQLIFVGSDSVATQQRTLSDFLAAQSHNTEVSFLTADESQSSSDYRRIICRQLANHTVGSFVRPLNELLHDMDADKGHYLVCIAKAQCIDMEFLQELWEWVTNARQVNANIHVNVILFANEQWTQDAQKWLPEHQSSKPVLLSSQSLDVVGFDVSALEELMAQRPSFFTGETRHSIIRKKWFIAAVLISFLLVFSALMFWQYPNEIDRFIQTGELPSNELAMTPKLVENQADESYRTVSEASDINSESPEQSTGYEPKLEVIAPKLANEILVSQWPAEADEALLEPTEADGGSESAQNETANDDAQALNLNPPSNNLPVNNTATDEQDFAVPDITSVAQLDANLAASLRDNNTSASVSSENQLSDFEFDEAQLLSLSEQRFVIQLSGIQNRSVLQSYIADNQLNDSTLIYETQRYGGAWYVVLHAESFGTIAEANQAILQLPDRIQSSGPFVKSLQQVHSEINN
ncbi:SPOR domain-containing protein [Ningiella sp. W23]|uniref:SPOR domain-containing protein n=1 Tax=Ningiella sp. W23 TaxID=3023715 RepID=UPI003757EF5B